VLLTHTEFTPHVTRVI